MGRSTGQDERANEPEASPRRRGRSIATADISALLRLVNELHDLPPDVVIRQRHMLAGLRRLLGAGRGASALVERHPQGVSSIQLTLSETRREADPWRPEDATWPRLARLSAAAGEAVVRTAAPRGLHRDAPAAGDELISVMRLPPSRGGPLMLAIDRKRNRAVADRSARPPRSPILVSVLRFARAGRRGFGGRERELLRLFHAQADWLFRVEPSH
jgi:hypothetical protein